MPVISTNLAANSAVRYLNMNSAMQTSSLSKLASGSRITQASDDAAGLAIATKISSDVTALAQAATNASHGISVLQTADGGASNISDILQRMKALASQSASGTVTDNERAYIQAEFSQLTDEIDAISVGTRYNGQSLLDGSSDFFNKGVSVMVGSDSADTITVALSALSSKALGLTANTGHTAQATLKANIQASAITVALTKDVEFSVNGTLVTLGKAGGGTAIGQWTTTEIGTAINAALSKAGNTSVTVNTTGLITSADNGGTIKIADFSGNTATTVDFQTLAVAANAATGVTAETAGDIAALPVSAANTQDKAKLAIKTLDAAINNVSAARASIGSLESRFGFHQASIATSIENLTAAVSAIKDTDVASEAAKLASSKVKTQAAVAAAAQASQMPQELLKLMQ